MAQTLKILDPVQGLIDYTNDIKPYHSKVIEALIEYVGTESIEVTVLEEFEFEIGLLYEFNGNFVCLIGGYGTPSFGDPENILVLSPDVSKTLIEYPAIGPGFFIVLGDKTVLFDPAVDVVLSISSSIEDRLADVNASIGSPPVGGSFTVFGDKQAEYAGVDFSIVGSAFNDGDYTVSSTTLIASPGIATQINVDQVVPTNNVEGFVSRISATNTGSLSVVNSTYNSRHLIPHTTVFVTGISLLAPTLTDPDNQRFVSYVNTRPLTYDSILSYSRALRQLGGSPVTSSYLADEGIVIAGIVSVTPTSVSVLGDFQSSNLFVGDEFYITDSSGNDGTYNIESLTYEYSGSPVSDFVTTFSVNALPDTNVDGNIKLNIPSNVFIIDGSDYTRFFTQGSRVNITSGSHIGQYTTLNSKYINDKTFIRVRETLIPEGNGRRILSTGVNYITVDGDVTAIYGGSPAQQFNIVTSAKNDGFYTTSSATYDSLTNTTQIGIVEQFDVTDNTGEIHEFTTGDITHLPEGFGATVDLCELVPQALAISSITEDFDILLGYKFVIDGTDSTTNKLYIQDPDEYAYGIFTSGSPLALNADTSIEIISSGINNGVYNITTIDSSGTIGSPLTTHTVLTLAGSPALEDSGIFTIGGSPEINGGFLLYKPWWQYYVTDITGNEFLVAGDATVDINTTNKNVLQHIFTDDIYIVTNILTEGPNTRITVSSPIITVAGSPSRDITAGSPIYDDFIISVPGILGIAPVVVFHAVATPLDFVSTNTITVTGGDFEVDWGDGTYVPYVAGAAASDVAINVGSPAAITVRSVNNITQVRFNTNTYTDIDIDICGTLTSAVNMCRDLSNLISFSMADTPVLLSLFFAWSGCTSLSSFAATDTASVTSFDLSWRNCQSLTTFPTINTSSGTDFGFTWQNCDTLLTFPPLDFSAAINVNSTWLGCDILTSFAGPLNFVNVEGLNQTFASCPALLWLPALPTSNCIQFSNLLNGSSSITCLTSIDTTAPGATTTDMFFNATALVAPNAAEQLTIESGSVYINSGACP